MTNNSDGRWIELGTPEPEPPHACSPPATTAARAAGAGVGAVWECGECAQRWRITEVVDYPDQEDAPKMPAVFSWSRL